MLHGWGANIDLLLPLGERLAQENFKVYMLDMPGFGESQAPPVAWTIFDYAQFVISYLDHHQLDAVYLFGHSFGGRLGLILGADHPDRIHKMALADSAGVRPPTPLSNRLRLGSYKFVRDALNSVGAKGTADQLRNWYNKTYGSTDFQQVTGVMRETFVKVVNEDLLPYAEQVAVPTLLFWGENDEDTPLWQGELLEKTIPNAGLIVHKGAGHYSYLDALQKTSHVMNFFYRQDEE